MIKDTAVVIDEIKVPADKVAPVGRGLCMSDGSPVPVSVIMKTFGVDRVRAMEIQGQSK